ncbi:Protein TIFY 5A [Abeliophyllum distichum]|uniref:Protein TIFY n=1 Tax=Abeliophyllum distichum TaxID=126358 RepID=A0ABD1PUU5_9LAMI
MKAASPSESSLSTGCSRPRHPLLDMKNSGMNRNEKKQNQQLTIFCNGKVAVCDVTELQARAIILVASREMEGKSDTKPGSDPWLLPFLESPLNSLSMKKSLQRFLQKRKARIQATSLYHQ